MKSYFLFFLVFCFHQLDAQTVISGKVTDTGGTPVEGANVYLDGTFDGTSTDAEGNFSFDTIEKGEQILIISFLSFETMILKKEVGEMRALQIKLREQINQLTGVTLTAGTFEAGDNSKVSVLKPLDVVTTASALGDVIGAFQTLPGTSTVAEDGRLFVRGGEANETQIFIDGLRVFTPYATTAANVPTRGRYSPFLFKGITFSTGGYSAEYGQALSGVMVLNTIEEPDQEKTDLAFMTVGGGVGTTKKWNKESLSLNLAYINLAPYLAIYEDRNTWHKAPESASGELVFRHKLNQGMIKFYSAFDYSRFDVEQKNINFPENIRYKQTNTNLYLNGSYKEFYGNGWSIKSGFSYTHAHNAIDIFGDEIKNNENSLHLMAKLKKSFSDRLELSFGAEHFVTDFSENFHEQEGEVYPSGFTHNQSAVYLESDIYLSNKIAAKIGLRSEYSELMQQFTLSPRISLAYKTGEQSQISLAYGNFYQNPFNEYLKYTPELQQEMAAHYILNYQYNHDGRIFRAETYYKKYSDLIKYNTFMPDRTSEFSNAGEGYSKGLDIFWRDNKSVKNLDYWISYSFLDTKRDYRNFSEQATPQFVNRHNFSVVTKYWIESLKSQVGTSYTFASGRPYTNPNEGGFLNQRTKAYNSLSINWAYLLDPQKILYFSVNNVLGTKNVLGYDYATTANANGIFAREAIRPNADTFFFVGFFWTISKDKKSNQLDNL